MIRFDDCDRHVVWCQRAQPMCGGRKPFPASRVVFPEAAAYLRESDETHTDALTIHFGPQHFVEAPHRPLAKFALKTQALGR
jgi:hypothetical protein